VYLLMLAFGSQRSPGQCFRADGFSLATSEESHYFGDSQSPDTPDKKNDWDFVKLLLAKSPE